MSFDIDYQWQGLDEAIKELDKRISVIEFEVDDWKKLGEFLVSYIKSEIQNEGHVVTGELLGSIRILEVGEDYVDVGSDVIQARILEYGRVEITKTDGFLVFQSPDTGEMVFTHHVKAVEPTHIFERSIKEGLEMYKEQQL